MMQRRTFAALLPGALAAQPKQISTALLTHADGPHLSAYLEGLAKTPEAHPVSLCDPSGQTEAAARKALGSKLTAVYRDYGELLRREKPAMALVTMEARLAPPVIAAALDYGAHVMAEKPACVNLRDFEALAQQAKRKYRQLLLALANRIDPVIVEAHRVMRSGEIGRIYGIEIHIVADQTRLTRPAYQQTWTAKKSRAGGGHLIWLGIHWLDLVTYFTGLTVTQVAAFTNNAGRQPNIDVEDSAALALRYSDGTLGSMSCGYYLDKGYHSMIKIWGAGGWLELRKHGSAVPLEWYSNRTGKTQRYEGATEPSGYTPFVQRVTRAFAGIEPIPLGTEDGVNVLKTVFAAYRAAETGTTVTIS